MSVQWEDVGIGFLLGITVSIIFVGFTLGDQGSLKAEAVEAGHAEYYLDENHDRQWRWKEGRDD